MKIYKCPKSRNRTVIFWGVFNQYSGAVYPFTGNNQRERERVVKKQRHQYENFCITHMYSYYITAIASCFLNLPKYLWKNYSVAYLIVQILQQELAHVKFLCLSTTVIYKNLAYWAGLFEWTFLFKSRHNLTIWQS